MLTIVCIIGAVRFVGMFPSTAGSLLTWHCALKYGVFGNIQINSYKKQSLQSVSEILFMQIMYI